MSMDNGSPRQHAFRKKILAIVDEFREGPMDDRLNYGDMVATFEYIKFELMFESHEIARGEHNE